MMVIRLMSASSLPFLFSSLVYKSCTSSSSICSWEEKTKKTHNYSTIIELYTVHSHKTRILSCSKPDKDIFSVLVFDYLYGKY